MEIKPLRALVVEGSEADTALLLRELRHGGYDPIHTRVETAETMSSELSAHRWDIVFSDFSMPNFNAFDALTLLHNSVLDLPFIIVSGTIGEDRAVTAMRAGAHDYILTGNLKRLVPAVDRELREARSRGMPGVGLGLSLVAAVAKLHGGSLELSDNHPGLWATLILGYREQ